MSKIKLNLVVLLIFLSTIISVGSQDVLSEIFIVEFTHFPNGSAEIISIETSEGSFGFQNDENEEYALLLLNVRDIKLYSVSIGSSFVTYIERLVPCEDVGYPEYEGELCLDGDEIHLNKTEQFVRLPYYKDAKYLEFLKDGEVKTRIKLEEYLCKFDENCPEFCQDKEIDPDCPSGNVEEVKEETVSDEKENGKIPLWLYFVIGGIVVLILFILFMSVRVERNV